MNVMNSFIYFVLLVAGLHVNSLASAAAKTESALTSLRLEWATVSRDEARGIRIFRLRLVNESDAPVTIADWYKEIENREVPSPLNVKICLRRKDTAGDPRILRGSSMVNVPRAIEKRIEPKQRVEIDAEVVLDVDEGEYEIWASLRSDQRVKSESRLIRVTPGVVPILRK